MSEFNYVKADALQTLEEYASSLIAGAASLKTLESYQDQANKLGLFDEVEEETSKTIIWEIRRLIALYKTQLTKIIERTGFDEEQAINDFRKMMPDVKIPRKKQTKQKQT